MLHSCRAAINTSDQQINFSAESAVYPTLCFRLQGAHLHLYLTLVCWKQYYSCVSPSLQAQNHKTKFWSVKFPLKSQRHLMPARATSCASASPSSASALRPPLACNKETRRSLAGGLPRVSPSLLFHLQGDKPRRSVSLQLAPPCKRGTPMWSMCRVLMLCPASAFKALCLFHMVRPSLITVPCRGLDRTPTTFWMWEPGRRRIGAGTLPRNANVL